MKYCKCSVCGRVIPVNPEFIQTSIGSGEKYVSYPHAIKNEPCNHKDCDGCFAWPENCVPKEVYLKYIKDHPKHAKEDQERCFGKN